jgi:hypothetical protein
MSYLIGDVTPVRFARVAGVGLLAMAAAAIFSSLVTQNLVVSGNASRTAGNIAAHQLLFRIGICSWLMVAALDVVVGLALYVVLKPVNRSLSLLAAGFRLVYAAVLVVGLGNFLAVLRLLSGAEFMDGLGAPQLNAQVMLYLGAFADVWALGLVLFGIHLALLGYLVWRSGYIPRILGVLLVVASAGYLVANLGKILMPSYGATLDLIVAGPAAVGELALAVWLLVKAARVPNAFLKV